MSERCGLRVQARFERGWPRRGGGGRESRRADRAGCRRRPGRAVSGAAPAGRTGGRAIAVPAPAPAPAGASPAGTRARARRRRRRPRSRPCRRAPVPAPAPVLAPAPAPIRGASLRQTIQRCGEKSDRPKLSEERATPTSVATSSPARISSGSCRLPAGGFPAVVPPRRRRPAAAPPAAAGRGRLPGSNRARLCAHLRCPGMRVRAGRRWFNAPARTATSIARTGLTPTARG